MKKKILIVFREMTIGGSTTSLLSLLSEIDASKYDIDLILLTRTGELLGAIPENVRILEPAYRSKLPLRLRKRLSVRNYYYALARKNENQRSQCIARTVAGYCRRLRERYDIGIAYLEGWPMYYLMEKTNAEKKICWLHINYSKSEFDGAIDAPYYDRADRIVLVSDACRADFDARFPQFREKTRHIPNLLSSKFVQRRVALSAPAFDWTAYQNEIKFVSVCRINFAQKGLDRAMAAFDRLAHEGLDDFVWVVIGEGPDERRMRERIAALHLEKHVFMLGADPNPLSTVAGADVFLLPSRQEGKPMAVTEAQMLGVMPLVTAYPSAAEQIERNADGIICENSDEGIYRAMRTAMTQRGEIRRMKDAVKEREYSNLKDLALVERLLEE